MEKKLSNEHKNKISQALLENHPNKKSVVCVNNGRVFETAVDGAKVMGLKPKNHVGDCCKGNRKSAGKHPTTGEPLVWMYYDDYLESVN